MTKVYADIEHQIEVHELQKFKDLADVLKLSVQETIELCMFEKRDEYLDTFANNIPENEQKDTDGQSDRHTGGTSSTTEKRVREEDVVNAPSEDGLLPES